MELKGEVVLVVEELTNLRNENAENDEKDSYWMVGKILSFVILAIGALFIIVGNFLLPSSWLVRPEYKQIFWMAFLFGTVLAAVLLAFDFKKSGLSAFIKDPTGDALKSMGDNLAAYVAMFERLDSFSTESIAHTRDELSRRSKVGHSVTGLLVGSLMKVGIVPAVVAILVTVSKVGDNASGAYVYEILSYMLVGFYFLCFRLGEAVFKFEQYSDLLNSYLIQREHKTTVDGQLK